MSQFKWHKGFDYNLIILFVKVSMSTDLNKKSQQLAQRLNNEKSVLYALNQLVKKQAMRALKLQNLFHFNKNQQQMFLRIYGSHNPQIYRDYSKLLSKQVSDKIAQYLKELEEIKASLSKVNGNIKSNKQDEASKTMGEAQKSLQELTQKISLFWNEQSYLIANYRMEICAKELQKWNRGILVMQSTSDPKKQINELFS